MELAEGLYSQLEEELHNLVSQSNSCLARLQFLRKVRELETQFGKVSWVSLGCHKLKFPLCLVPWLSVLLTFPLILMTIEAWRMAGLPEV